MGFLRLRLCCVAPAFILLYTSCVCLFPQLQERFGCAGTKERNRTDSGALAPVGVAGWWVEAGHHVVARGAPAAAQGWRDAAACRGRWKVDHPRGGLGLARFRPWTLVTC